MKKHLFSCIAVFGFILFLGSCRSQPIVFNESLPADNIATIRWCGPNIVAYNGISVDWKNPMWSPLFVKIPGGRTEFEISGLSRGGLDVTYRNTPFVFNFEGGNEYYIRVVGHIIEVFNGSSPLRRNLITSFNMLSGQQEIPR